MKFAYLTALAFASTVVGQGIFHSGLDEEKCLDSTRFGVIIYDCDHTPGQQWIVDVQETRIHPSKDLHQCLETDDKPRAGSSMSIKACNVNHDWQKFEYKDHHIKIEGFCLSVYNHNTSNGRYMMIDDCDVGDDGQTWFYRTSKSGKE